MNAEPQFLPPLPITVQAEPLSDNLYHELAPLFQREWEEVGYRKDILKLDIDLQIMDALARMNRLAIFTVREDSILVGYMIFTLGAHPKYKTTIWASMNGWWVAPEARRPTVAKQLLDFAQKALKSYGVQICQAAARVDHPAAGRLLEAMGFEEYERGYFKAL